MRDPLSALVRCSAGLASRFNRERNIGPVAMSTRDQILRLKQRMGESIIG